MIQNAVGCLGNLNVSAISGFQYSSNWLYFCVWGYWNGGSIQIAQTEDSGLVHLTGDLKDKKITFEIMQPLIVSLYSECSLQFVQLFNSSLHKHLCNYPRNVTLTSREISRSQWHGIYHSDSKINNLAWKFCHFRIYQNNKFRESFQ